MNMFDFFENLGTLYPVDEDDEAYKKRICLYYDLITKKAKETGKEPDFDKTLENIVTNYPYRTFPNFNFILEHIKYKPNPYKLQENLKLRGFRVNTDMGVYDFWGYIPKNEKIKLIRGFKVLKEIT